jgi:serine/threonine protein kinase
MVDAIGAVLGERYRLEAPLGRGGMGTMWRAHDRVLDRDVAIKVLDPQLVADEGAAARFDREAVAISRLDHPNCVQVFDAGTTPEGGKFIVMQLLAGYELRQLLDAGPLGLPRAIELGLQILRGLEHAHRRGVVHRDLKPENVFVVYDDDGREQVKLVDFGIVKLLSESAPKITRAGQVFGTPRYMSPEQISGGAIDERTDLYSFGAMFFEMLTGAPPFDADQPGMLMRMHMIADVPALPDTLPANLRTLVTRLLEKRAVDRPSSAREVIEAIAPGLHASTPALPPITVRPSAPPVEVRAEPVGGPPTEDGVAWIIPPREVPRSRPSSVLGRPPNLALRAVGMVLLVVLVGFAALLCNSWRDAQ